MSSKFVDNSEQASRKLVGSIVFQLNSAAKSVETIAHELAAVDTGEMKSKIRQTEVATDGSLRSAVEAGAEHSEFVEYGTVNQDAQPFMTPAYESAKKQLLSMRGIF